MLIVLTFSLLLRLSISECESEIEAKGVPIGQHDKEIPSKRLCHRHYCSATAHESILYRQHSEASNRTSPFTT